MKALTRQKTIVKPARITDSSTRQKSTHSHPVALPAHRDLFMDRFPGVLYQKVINRPPHFIRGSVKTLTGYNAEDFLTKRVRWRDLVHPSDIADYNKSKSKILKSSETLKQEYRIVDKNEHIHWVEEILHYIKAEQNNQLIQGLITDITERKQTEEASELLYQTTKIISQTTSHTKGVREVLKVLYQKLDTPLGIIWHLGQNESTFVPGFIWQKTNRKSSLGKTALDGLSLPNTSNLLGRSWQKERCYWIADIGKQTQDPILLAASRLGFQSSFIIPITYQSKRYGLIQLFSSSRYEPDTQLLKALETIGSQTGHIIAYKQAQGEKEVLFKKHEHEKQRAEQLAQTMKSERDIFYALMENTQTHLAYLDKELRFVYVNNIYAKHSGFSKDELIGAKHFDLFPSKENEKIFRQVLKSGKGVQFVRKPFVYSNQPEKDVTYWDWTLIPVTDVDNRVLGLALSLVDVTDDYKSDRELEELLYQVEKERERATQLALEAERRASELDALFIALADPLVVYDAKGICVSANPSALTILGFDIIGKNRTAIIRQLELRDESGKPVKLGDLSTTEALQGNVSIGKPMQMTNSQGDRITVVTSASPIIRNDRVEGVVAVLHDISEREELERQKDEFISIASHELKTPLTTVKALVQLLQVRNYQADDIEDIKYLTKIEDQLNKLTSLISELLDVTRIEAGKLEMQKELFDFNELIDSTIENTQTISPSHRIIKIGRVNKKVFADRHRLEQVMSNLILNAIKYSPEADKVVVRIFEKNNHLIVAVKDYGLGISQENRDKIFQKFYRISGPAGERFPGLGLGLHIASQIIEKHNGKIWVRSTEGKGSTFYFMLPTDKKW